MTSDASLPPNAPTTPTPTMTTPGTATNGSLTPQPQAEPEPQSNSLARPPLDSAKAARDVGGEADASAEFLDDEHDGTELDVPPNPVPLSEVCRDVNARVAAFLALDSERDAAVKCTQDHVRASVDVLARALEDYGFEHLSLSYNGGKDCLVLLLLYLSVLHTHFTTSQTSTPFPPSIPSIYATPPDPFPAVTRFVASSSSQYHLSLTHIRTNPPPSSASPSHPTHPPPPPPSKNLPIRTFRDAFALYLTTHPTVRAIFVGTRRTDPHGGSLVPFAATDGNWPRFMRVHPVLDWGLREIWCFLRHPALSGSGSGSGSGTGAGAGVGSPLRELSYCAMYDEGYTSLGGRGDTVRNPLLRVEEADGQVRYRPAWMMVEDDEERAGRE